MSKIQPCTIYFRVGAYNLLQGLHYIPLYSIPGMTDIDPAHLTAHNALYLRVLPTTECAPSPIVYIFGCNFDSPIVFAILHKAN